MVGVDHGTGEDRRQADKFGLLTVRLEAPRYRLPFDTLADSDLG